MKHETQELKKECALDAKNKSLGRVASETAILLRGKNLPDFKPNAVPQIKVKILNLSKIKLTGKKWDEKTYKRYSGYPGGLKIRSYQSLFEKDPEEAFRKTVRGMLPKNKLRKIMLRNLIFE
jgi:large subunit ribosomal protein L13